MNFFYEKKINPPEIDKEKNINEKLEKKFLFFIEDLEKEGFEKEILESLKNTGFLSSYFQDAFLKGKTGFKKEDIISDLNLKYSEKSLNYIKEKNISSVNELKYFLYSSVKKEMARIAYRDINGRAGLGETLNDLSKLADESVKKAVDYLHLELASLYGEPVDENGSVQRLIVVAMGKLGAFELNFSSDIDLILVFPGAGKTNGERSISSEEFFIKLAQKFISVFKGPVPGDDIFRVDLRLRPFGDNGPLVMSINAMEHYYMTQGREWERYALIKARCITGDTKSIADFYKSTGSFVFRRYLDYGAFDSMRDMKKKIIFEIKRKDNEKNIKNGSGGIREVEFFGQVFQLIRGGIDKKFREKGIISILRLLSKEKMVPDDVIKELESSYCFLRFAENRIQQLRGEQTHLLPDGEEDLEKVAIALGFENVKSFLDKVKKTREVVHYHFMGILKDDSDEKEDDEITILKMLWDSPEYNKAQSLEALDDFGINPSPEILRLVESFRKEVDSMRIPGETSIKVEKLMPFIIKEFFTKNISADAANRVLGIISSTIKKSCYLSLLVENRTAVSRLVNLCMASSWIGNYLKNHPVLLDELLDSRSLYYPPEKDDMSMILDSRITGIDSENIERILETICIFKQSMTLRVAAAEISGGYPLMKISDRLTELAEVIIERVVQVAWIELVEKFGYPVDKKGEKLLTPGVAVIAYGKLGGIELGYGSDLDLVFVHNDVEEMTCGRKTISCVHFYSKLAQKVLSYLSLHTSAGRMYEIDLRLRPGGSSGVVIVSKSGFIEYFTSSAWTFEHQTFVKARIVYGHPDVASSLEETRNGILGQERDKSGLAKEIREMREKIVQANGLHEKEFFHLKYDDGGMMDIEFLAQYLVLLNGSKNKKIFSYTDTIRVLSTLEKEGILSVKEASFLRFAYLVYRSKAHKLDLVDKKAVLEAGRFSSIRAGVQRIWKTHLLA